MREPPMPWAVIKVEYGMQSRLARLSKNLRWIGKLPGSYGELLNL